MCDAHPVESAVQRALRDVEVGVEVEVEEPDPIPARHRAGDRSDPDRAVAAQHEREVVAREHVGNAVGDRPSSGNDALEVLGERALAIGTPAEPGHVAAIGDRQPCLLEAADEARRSQGSGRLLLSRRVRARARGCADQPYPPAPPHRLSLAARLEVAPIRGTGQRALCFIGRSRSGAGASVGASLARWMCVDLAPNPGGRPGAAVRRAGCSG